MGSECIHCYIFVALTPKALLCFSFLHVEKRNFWHMNIQYLLFYADRWNNNWHWSQTCHHIKTRFRLPEGFCIHTGWPFIHDRVFLILFKRDLSSVRYCTLTYTMFFTRNQNNTAMFVWSRCTFKLGIFIFFFSEGHYYFWPIKHEQRNYDVALETVPIGPQNSA